MTEREKQLAHARASMAFTFSAIDRGLDPWDEFRAVLEAAMDPERRALLDALKRPGETDAETILRALRSLRAAPPARRRGRPS